MVCGGCDGSIASVNGAAELIEAIPNTNRVEVIGAMEKQYLWEIGERTISPFSRCK
jgi:hypothetical protein